MISAEQLIADAVGSGSLNPTNELAQPAFFLAGFGPELPLKAFMIATTSKSRSP